MGRRGPCEQPVRAGGSSTARRMRCALQGLQACPAAAAGPDVPERESPPGPLGLLHRLPQADNHVWLQTRQRPAGCSSTVPGAGDASTVEAGCSETGLPVLCSIWSVGRRWPGKGSLLPEKGLAEHRTTERGCVVARAAQRGEPSHVIWMPRAASRRGWKRRRPTRPPLYHPSSRLAFSPIPFLTLRSPPQSGLMGLRHTPTDFTP